jgi:hypothetical protein
MPTTPQNVPHNVPQDLLRQLMALVVNVFDAHTAAVFLRGADDRYDLAAYFSLSDHVDTRAAVAPGAGLAGWVVKSGKPLTVNHFDRTKGVVGYYRFGSSVEIKAFMGLPLDNGLGALCLDSMRTYAFSAKDQKILSDFAGLIVDLVSGQRGVAEGLETKRYLGSLHRQTALRAEKPSWPDLLEHSLANMAAAADMDHGFLAVRGEEEGQYHVEGCWPPGLLSRADRGPLPMSAGVVGWVFRHNAAMASGQAQPGGLPKVLFGANSRLPAYGRMVCLPLTFQRRVRGVLVVAGEAPGPVDEDLMTFLRLAADNLTLFLENLYLKNRLTGS